MRTMSTRSRAAGVVVATGAGIALFGVYSIARARFARM